MNIYVIEVEYCTTPERGVRRQTFYAERMSDVVDLRLAKGMRVVSIHYTRSRTAEEVKAAMLEDEWNADALGALEVVR